MENLYFLDKLDLWFVIKCYNDYIKSFIEETQELEDIERTPVCIEEFYNNEYQEYYQYYLDLLWEDLGYINIDEKENIDEDFYIWQKGTNREIIWHWFDERVENGIGNRYFN